MMYENPIPVAVCIVPVAGKVLGVVRGIHPGQGKIALPGGFINTDETWQQACARELFEETGLKCNPDLITLYAVESALDSRRILIFGKTPEMKADDINFSYKCVETECLKLIEEHDQLAFPLHTKIVQKYLS